MSAKSSHWVVGHHAVNALLATSPERAIALFVVPNSRNAAQNEALQYAKQLGIVVHSLDKKALSKRCKTEQHQGIALEAKAKRDGSEKELETLLSSLNEQGTLGESLFLVLDQVQDPHNFGACLRTADAAGVTAVIVAKDNASPMTPVVQKVASGAAETMTIFRVSNLARTLDTMKQSGVWLVGTSDKAEGSIYQQNLTGALAILMGAEGKGLRALTEKKCDTLLSLPMAGSVVSSLNVSVATGVCLFEAVRQRAKI